MNNQMLLKGSYILDFAFSMSLAIYWILRRILSLPLSVKIGADTFIWILSLGCIYFYVSIRKRELKEENKQNFGISMGIFIIAILTAICIPVEYILRNFM